MEKDNFKIEEKAETSKGKFCSYEYFLKFADGREGYCRLYIDLVRKFAFHFTKAQMSRFRKHGIKSGDLGIWLDDFHPHGKGLNPDKCNFMRKGVGTKVLNLIIEKLKKHSPKFIYCQTSTTSMKEFVKKQGWSPCNRRKTTWAKIL